jgi:hypothetical protein
LCITANLAANVAVGSFSTGTITTEDGKELRIRAAGDVDFEGIADRSAFKPGMRLTVNYLEPQDGKAPLGFDATEIDAE